MQFSIKKRVDTNSVDSVDAIPKSNSPSYHKCLNPIIAEIQSLIRYLLGRTVLIKVIRVRN